MNDLIIKNFIEKPLQLRKVEFWAATTICVFAMFVLFTSGSSDRWQFKEAGISYHYYEHYFFPRLVRYALLYLGFVLLSFIVVPSLIRKEKVVLNILLIVILFLTMGLVMGVVDTYTKAYLLNRYATIQDAYYRIFQASFHHAFWLLLMFGFYSVIKFTGLYLLANSAAIQSRYKMITRDAIVAFFVWLVIMFLLLVVRPGEELVLAWGIIALSAIVLCSYSFYSLIPKSLRNKRPFLSYLLKALLIMVISFMPLAFIGMLITDNEEVAFGVSMFNVFFQLLFTVPLSWVLYRQHLKGHEELYVLKKELGKSNANLDFLRSQINPHFLFNALNTLYGTALHENSERTAQGIQMLGDMMRFMLHENLQHKILLSREIEYMQNYIELQSLRTSVSPNIVIETKIQDVLTDKFIAPMLLIPFVENAFKHGISLKHKSWIKVTLNMVGDKLYFDMYNSTRLKQEQDPEKDKSGVGLVNVRQRLDLLYPEKYELIIRETAEEYFVHLTLQL
ncbi:histidine kinase [Pontibacter ummariensis]|uniref:Histidine kinase n=2 Tax=Pontibacter ummariensis TaxID=1610492 RepID=A0A239L607_9BACT|nr:histidine kinase [Pontibacter ummariensis]SNT25881.1 Histidine kinase [Pontibacter ummariensis]